MNGTLAGLARFRRKPICQKGGANLGIAPITLVFAETIRAAWEERAVLDSQGSGFRKP